MNKLSGKKTYVIGGLLLAAGVAYHFDMISSKEWEGILTALGGAVAITLRHALASMNNGGSQ